MSSRKLTNINNSKIPLNRGKYSAKNIFSTYITVDELHKHPELYPSLKREKKLLLDVLSQKKPKIINIKGIHNESKSKFASRLNSFYKVFFNYYKQHQYSSENKNVLSQENKDFLKKYKKTNKSNEIINSKNKFYDIQQQYEKKDYHVSSLDSSKNLFNGNILLSNKKELKNYILYDLGTPKSNEKSISFLHKINKKLGDKASEKALKEIYDKLDMETYNKDKIERDKENDILGNQNDIFTLQQTIDSIDDIEHFFKLGNKHYLNHIKYNDNNSNNYNDRKSSAKISTRYNSANIKNENEKSSNNVSKNFKKQISKKASANPLQENKDKIKKNKLGLSINNIDNKFNKYLKEQIKTFGNNNTLNSPLENLYEKMYKKEDLLIYQPEIKDYLENKKYDVSVKLNPSIICNNFEKTREKICTSEFLKNNMQLRKQIGNVESKVEEINDNDIKVMNKMNNIEDKMIKLFCDINNPKPKE